MQTWVNYIEKVKLKSPIMIEGLPGIGNVGRLSAGYLVSELKMKKFAELYSPNFHPIVVLHEDSALSLLKCEFYYHKGRQDLIVVTGDTQSVTPEGHYDICEKIIDVAERMGAKTVITLGGFAEGKPVDEPHVIGAVSNSHLIKKYSKFGIDFGKKHPIGVILGASGLLVGMAKLRGMDGLCLMGETLGMPMTTDPKVSDRVLRVVSSITGLKLDLSKLENTIKEMEERIKKTDVIHKKMIEESSKNSTKSPRYIG
jgi:uncharacterized protein (TIGR00162 family)